MPSRIGDQSDRRNRQRHQCLAKDQSKRIDFGTEAFEALGAVRTRFATADFPWSAVFHLETAAKLLKLLEANFADFSKSALKSLNNQADFDSVIRRFDPSRPSQAQLAEFFTETVLFSRAFLMHLEMDEQLSGGGSKKIEQWPPSSFLSALALAQHYGAPTRLLDWS